jgi:hypothetical protein
VKETNAIRAKLREQKSLHLKDRDIRIAIASRIKTKNMLRSNGFPSSRTRAAWPTWPVSHCEGSRDPTMNIQITGTHKAKEVFECLAGSQPSSANKRMSQRNRAKEGGMVSLWDGDSDYPALRPFDNNSLE